eukprot:scaffold4232_cov179-Ochromonas_danica.AAC.1
MRRTQNETYDEIRDKKHNTTFVFLAPQANNPIWDHSMMGPTYRYAMMLEAKAMKDRLRRFFALQQRDRDLVRLARKRVAKMTGMHHFWDWQVYGTSSSLLRRMRKSAAQWTRRHGYFSGKYAEQQNNSVMFDEGALFGNGEMAMSQASLFRYGHHPHSSVTTRNWIKIKCITKFLKSEVKKRIVEYPRPSSPQVVVVAVATVRLCTAKALWKFQLRQLPGQYKDDRISTRNQFSYLMSIDERIESEDKEDPTGNFYHLSRDCWHGVDHKL